MFYPYTLELFSILKNNLIGYADDSTLISVVPSPGVRVAVAGSVNHDLRESARLVSGVSFRNEIECG